MHRAYVKSDWLDYNGHMSEAYYVLVFGHATDAFYDSIGLDQAARERQRSSVYTVEAHIRYFAEAGEGDQLTVITNLLHHDTRHLRLRHTMHRNTTELASTELLALHVDMITHRAAPFGAESLARLAGIAQSGAPPPPPIISRHWSPEAASVRG